MGTLVTPGRSDLRQQSWVAKCVPAELSGARVLDIGAWDGFFSFLAEGRHATQVLAIDSFQNPEDHADTPRTFALAKEALGSKVEYRHIDLMDLPVTTPPFDTVFFFGVYYHLKEPMAALEKIRSLLRPGGKLFLEGMIRLGNQPELHYFAPEEIEPTTCCAATISGLERMCQLAGFRSARMLSRTDGIKTRVWFYSTPPSRLQWGVVSLYRHLAFPSARPRAFLEVLG
ncbi:MAG: class I SAM-dependent methyltransferase [Thermoplasmata archaeon]|nr:class I SAM-dependent methyltransferase [Thermoplasmata archaeon]